MTKSEINEEVLEYIEVVLSEEEIEDVKVEENSVKNKELNNLFYHKNIPIKLDSADDAAKSKNCNEESTSNIRIKSEPIENLSVQIKSESPDVNSVGNIFRSRENNIRNFSNGLPPNTLFLKEEFGVQAKIKLEPTIDSDVPNPAYLNENHESHDKNDPLINYVKYSVFKKEREEINRITKDDKKKRPAKWLELARIYCPKCNKEREKKRRETGKSCPTCSTLYILKCAGCNGIYKNVHTISRHLRWGVSKCYDKLKTWICCEQCSYSSASVRRVESHMEEKHGKVAPQKRYKCKKCGKHYAVKSYKNDHQKKCQRKAVIECKLCDFRCRCEKYFANHMRRAHNDNEHYKDCYESKNSMICNHCPFVTYYKKVMIKHLYIKHNFDLPNESK